MDESSYENTPIKGTKVKPERGRRRILHESDDKSMIFYDNNEILIRNSRNLSKKSRKKHKN